MRDLNKVLKKGPDSSQGVFMLPGRHSSLASRSLYVRPHLGHPKLCQMVFLQSPGHRELVPLVTCHPVLCCSFLCLTVRL